jgi:Starch-binding associating with outer membrane/Susd and RagB outer membrane lipoprotein
VVLNYKQRLLHAEWVQASELHSKKNIMKQYKILFFVAALVLSVTSCKKKLDDLLSNPNTPTLDKADVDLYLNGIQLSFADFYNTMSDRGSELSRLNNMGGNTYLNTYRPETFNGVWGTAYRSLLTQINAMEPLATAQNKWHHIGIGQVLKAYTGMTLVDNFGDVPWSEAANPTNSVINPKIDKGSDVYAACIALLDAAIVNFNKVAGAPVSNDIYYNGGAASTATSITRWKTLANTLKLKGYMTTRLVDATVTAKINTLISGNDLIDTEAEDFVFRFGTNLENPASRHPKYTACYRAASAGGVGIYISNYLAWEMATEKGIVDPRIRYYFRRQTNSRSGQLNSAGAFYIPATAVSCQGALSPGHFPANMAYCMVGDGYFGRDHGDPSGIPPDGQWRAAWGVYPCGGDFDALAVNPGTNGSSALTQSLVTLTTNPGGRGAGIHPIWLSSFTQFLLAEANLTLSTSGNARNYLDSAMKLSFAKVIGFPATVSVAPAAAFVPSTAQVDFYRSTVLNSYDAAANNADKLNIIMKEYHIAAFGNGIEPYNNYRRTGMPRNMQPTLNPAPGPFIRSFWYPADHVTLNLNAKQKADNTVRVFWDNGSATLF